MAKVNPLQARYDQKHPNGVKNSVVKTPTGSGIPHVPQVNQSGGTNRATSLNPLTKQYEANHPAGALGAGNGTAMPWETDPIALGQIQSAGTNYGNRIEGIGASRKIGEQGYGLEHEQGDNGVFYDDYANNSYSQAAILQHNHENQERGLGVTAGQNAFSGQFGNQQGINTGHKNQAFTGLRQENESFKAGLKSEEQQALESKQAQENEAKENSIPRYLEQHPAEGVVGGDGGNGGGGNGNGGNDQQKEKIPYPAPAKKKWEWNGSHWHLVKA